MIKPTCSNCYDYLSPYEMVLNKHYKLDKYYCKECMFGLKPIVEEKYDLEKVALDRKGYKSWSEWGDYRKRWNNLKGSHGSN